MDHLNSSDTVYCKNHPGHQISFIKVSFQNEQILKCLQCLLEEDGKIQDYLALETIKVCNDDHIFLNWPSLDDNRILKNIQHTIKNNKYSKIEEIELAFSQFTKEILEEIFKKKKAFILQVQTQNQVQEDLLKIYNEVSGKQKLKELINIRKQTDQNDYEGLKKFIQENQQQKESITNILKEQLIKLDNIQTNITNDFSQLKSIIQKKMDSFFDPENFNLIKDLSKQLQQHQQNSQINELYGKSSYCDYNNSIPIQIQELQDQNTIQIIKNDPKSYGGVYFKYDLTKESKYTFRFKFNDTAGDYFIIGLIDSKEINFQLNDTNQGKIFCNNITNYKCYASQIVKGNLFYKIQKDLEIEMRVDIENRQVDFLDYPNYLNQNQLNRGYQLEKNGKYYLAIHFSTASQYTTCIDLTYFKIEK
ncbi:hypothetical protein TTHERM_00377290 (macronuclear) [Tetrahymena thermophila SB210]|uniref:Kinase domain protein n=1 Tax=Tetrahymena thermophila (strain SB210) TaxID=312017 RepID=Q23FI9_TETTS|nr:hypothetical protein TTHERM_00377290 [Tetrahymena thermophila SB210]EAR95164.1 hypothetical protein TTHERM_00377290 [Tetrahymena thermophila SB210]|eukprot:XP_001015409.1 hypothetical protein TTHERM_00377290 [Tetrahymena thermophila SB210]